MTSTSASPTLDPTTWADDDPRSIFARAHATSAAVIAGVAAEDMGRSTPCDEFDVRTLLGHLLAVAQRVTNVGRGESPFSVPEVIEGIGDDGWGDAWREVGVAMADAWADDATLERIVELPWATIPGGATLVMWSNELSVHSWDLATATGQDVEWDETVLAAAFFAMQMGLPAEGRAEAFEAARQNMPAGQEGFTPPFAEAVPVPDDAPLIQQLVAWNGRDPR